MFRISVELGFSAAHSLRIEHHKCENLHGHNWKVLATIRGSRLNEYGMLMDFHDLKAALRPVLARLDHVMLNTVEPFTTLNPTAENIARHIACSLAPVLPPEVELDCIKVFESEGSSAEYFPQGDEQ
jgi:6-pyruvoyltetrahydropterin/6-carboxytetrahydropterin synthase